MFKLKSLIKVKEIKPNLREEWQETVKMLNTVIINNYKNEIDILEGIIKSLTTSLHSAHIEKNDTTDFLKIKKDAEDRIKSIKHTLEILIKKGKL